MTIFIILDIGANFARSALEVKTKGHTEGFAHEILYNAKIVVLQELRTTQLKKL